MSDATVSAVLLTLKVASLATLLTAATAIPLARFLARRRGPHIQLLYALFSLPLVLPPTAVGYVLLQLLASEGQAGLTLLGLPADLLLTWQAAVIAAAVMSFPLVLRGAKATFDALDPRLEAMGRSLGWSPTRAAIKVTLPLAGRGLLAALILGFTRAASEFGATITVAGNIPFQTQTLPSAIYAAQQLGRDGDAVALIVLALLLGLAALLGAEWLVWRSAQREVSS